MSDLAERMARGDIVAAPGVWDAFGACLAASLGFPAVYLGGNAVGLHLGKGQPFVDAREMVETVARVRSAVDLPIVVDAAAGFGDAAHVHRSVRDLERAGASALHIDDQLHPKRAHYHLGIGRLEAVDVVAAKLAEAVSARRDPRLLVIARTDALRVTRSLDATIERAAAYARAGVDALLVLDAGTEQVRSLAAALPDLTLAWIAAPRMSPPSLDELRAAGIRLALYPFQGIAAVTEAMLATWEPLASGGRPGDTRRTTKELLDLGLRLVDMPTYWEIERRTTERPSSAAPRLDDH